MAQIYRLWQDEAGKKWINACWYYRPEQTVHRVSKRFYKNEVMKTGQYRDHMVDDIVDRCFVMFHTRYHRGRPRGLPPNKEVYVCEARYNEDKYSFNRIKTWTSCLPDEVRERDYEMDFFDIPRKLVKEPTPIAHLLKEGAKENDPLPKPNWGHKDAPPIIGGVHIRPREPNVSRVPAFVFFPSSLALSSSLSPSCIRCQLPSASLVPGHAIPHTRVVHGICVCLGQATHTPFTGLGRLSCRARPPQFLIVSDQCRVISPSFAQNLPDSPLPAMERTVPWVQLPQRSYF